MSLGPVAAVLLLSWLLGSVSPSYLLVRMVKGSDIRALGSGNAGATNVYRVLGLKGAIPVFLFDFLKGFAPVWLVLHSGLPYLPPSLLLAMAAGTLAFLGHLFPVFHGFRGGKGVATGAGMMSALYPPLFPACLGLFLLVALLTRRISVASMFAALSVPFWYAGLSLAFGQALEAPLLAFTIVLALAVLVRHGKNLRAIRAGAEGPIA